MAQIWLAIASFYMGLYFCPVWRFGAEEQAPVHCQHIQLHLKVVTTVPLREKQQTPFLPA